MNRLCNDCHRIVTGWTLTDMEHHITQLERLTYRLTHETYPTEGGAF